jgi:hypothetical protein
MLATPVALSVGPWSLVGPEALRPYRARQDPTHSGFVLTASGSPRPPPWGRWTVACGAGETIGMAAAAVTAALLSLSLGEPTDLRTGLLLWIGTTLGGVIEGLALALLTYPLLHTWLPRLTRRSWVGATVAVTLIGWALGSAPSTLVAGAVGGFESTGTRVDSAGPPLALVLVVTFLAGLALGSLFGAAQASVLRHHVAHAWRWVPVNALGWSLALSVIMVGATTAPAGLPLPALMAWGAVTGVMAGLTIGAVTGFFLPTLDQQAPRASTWTNRAVLGLLRSPGHRLLSWALVEIDYVGRSSGARFALPAQYARGDDLLVVWPGHPDRKRWWRNFREPSDVGLLIAGERVGATARVVLPATQEHSRWLAVYSRRFAKHPPPEGDPLVVLALDHSIG